ncbi:hypothetical protein HanOQP8_Chr16g0627881 [Helianthus annuus]|nr:hypothetical protein HanHA89_Chr16g0672901 [Helianthus annuus]KAJ0645793.1 hypothetical protein HanOQP8_Chr16g0627881 [Helianthus annuus]
MKSDDVIPTFFCAPKCLHMANSLLQSSCMRNMLVQHHHTASCFDNLNVGRLRIN